jgi:hypothetical protein
MAILLSRQDGNPHGNYPAATWRKQDSPPESKDPFLPADGRKVPATFTPRPILLQRVSRQPPIQIGHTDEDSYGNFSGEFPRVPKVDKFLTQGLEFGEGISHRVCEF